MGMGWDNELTGEQEADAQIIREATSGSGIAPGAEAASQGSGMGMDFTL